MEIHHIFTSASVAEDSAIIGTSISVVMNVSKCYTPLCFGNDRQHSFSKLLTALSDTIYSRYVFSVLTTVN